MQKTIPAISIVIPMYNVEKYIGECLDSILAQTFQDYEVIVVDDCSTDNSCAVVESYIPKFGEKLRLIHSEKNSGAPGIPNNIGFSLSQGEYISFIESDDMITKTALEELYPIAKKFDADVVHCERYFQFTDNPQASILRGYQTGELVKEPTLITEDFAERVKDLYNRRFLWNVWTKLIRRKYIIQNNLQMADANHHDAIYTCCLVCSAPRYVRVPNVINFYRILADSMSHRKQDIAKAIGSKMKSLTRGFDYINKFLSTQEFFQKRPDVKHLALEVWAMECLQYLQSIYRQIPVWQINPIIRRELENLSAKNDLMAFIFSRMNVFNVQLSRQNQIIQQLNAHIEKQNQVIRQLQAQLKN